MDSPRLLPNRITRRRALAGLGTAGLGAAALGLVGCGDDDDSSTPDQGEAPKGSGKPEGELVVLLSDMREQNFLPNTGSGTRQLYTQALFDYPFFGGVADTKIQPGVITDATLSPDGLTWTGKVRDNVLFHNSTAKLTSADIKFTLELSMQEGSLAAYAAHLRDNITEITAADPSQLVIKFKSPEPDFSQAYMSLYAFYLQIVSKEHVDSVGIQAADQSPVGTGPYKFSSKSPNVITYEAVEGNWRVTPEFRTLTYRNVPEVATQLNLMESGAADLVSVSFDAVGQFPEGQFKRFTSPGAYNAHLLFGNNYMPSDKRYAGPQPWSDIRVRQALNIAIDREAIAKSIYGGFAKPARIGHLDSLLPADVKPYPYDPSKAKALLRDAGAEGVSITLNSWSRDPGKELPDLVQIVAQAWSQVGVQVKILPRDYADFRKAWFAGQASGEVFPLTLNAFYPSWAEEALKWYGVNQQIAVWEHEGIESALAKLKVELDSKRRSELETEIAKNIYDNYAEIPLVVADTIVVGSKKVGEWKPPARWYPMYHEYATHNPSNGTPKPYVIA